MINLLKHYGIINCRKSGSVFMKREQILDPEIAKLREKRKRRRLEKELKELKKYSKRLKPVEELTISVKSAITLKWVFVCAIFRFIINV